MTKYCDEVKPALYERCPKEVFAAMCVSFLINQQSVPREKIDSSLLEEWKILYGQGLVTQRPPSKI
jgi:hypothetical protein